MFRQAFQKFRVQRSIQLAGVESHFHRAFFEQHSGGVKFFHILHREIAHHHAAPGGIDHQPVSFEFQAGFFHRCGADAEIGGKLIGQQAFAAAQSAADDACAQFLMRLFGERDFDQRVHGCIIAQLRGTGNG